MRFHLNERCFNLFLMLVLVAALAPARQVEGKEICPGGEILWYNHLAVGCLFYPGGEIDLGAILKVCEGTDFVGFLDDRVVCVRAALSPGRGFDFAGVKAGPAPAQARPAELAGFDQEAGCEHATAGTVAWWPLDGISGEEVAEVVADNHGRRSGKPVPISGKSGGALRYDGVDDYLQARAPLPISTGDFSLETWLRSTQRTTGTLLDQRTSDRIEFPDPEFPGRPPIEARPVIPGRVQGFSLFLYQGRPGLQLADGNHTNYVASRDVADGAWHHVIVTVDRDATDGIRWYVDGEEITPRQNPTGRQGSLSNPGPLRLGARSFSLNGLFAGDQDEVLVHDRVLTAAEARTASERPRCKNAAVAASCQIAAISPANPTASQAVDFIGFVQPEPGCFYSWQWSVDGTLIATTPSVNSFTGLTEGDHLICYRVEDTCSPIVCHDCRWLKVSAATLPAGTYCGQPHTWWLEQLAAGVVNIIDESGSDRSFIQGTNGRDLILANDGNNVIDGLGASDCIYGFGGNDRIHGDRTGFDAFISGDDEIYGGEGQDHLQGDAGNDRLFGEAGDDDLEGDSGDDFLSGGQGNDYLQGDAGGDELQGDEGMDCLKGDSGPDRMFGGPGNDDLKGDSGRDAMWGGPGRDALKGDSGQDEIHGGPGDDLAKGDSSGDEIWGDDGNDRLCGDGNGVTRDQLHGGPGHDGCRSGRRSQCESTPSAGQCNTDAWESWNSDVTCPR